MLPSASAARTVPRYLITPSARTSTVWGSETPIAFAV
jgi:hypothetical protein